MGEGRYTRIKSRFWVDEKVRGWSDDEKLLALYLLTSPHNNMLGCYVLPKLYVCEDLGWDQERVSKAFAKVLAEGFIAYDDKARLVLLTNYLRHNPIDHGNRAAAAEKIVQELPRSKLLLKLAEIVRAQKKPYLSRLAETLERQGLQDFAEDSEEGFRKAFCKDNTKHTTADADADATADADINNTRSLALAERDPPELQGMSGGAQEQTDLPGKGLSSSPPAEKPDSLNKRREGKLPGGAQEEAGTPLKAAADSGTGDRAMGETPQEEPVSPGKGRKKPSAEKLGYPQEFEEFWNIYPRRVEKLRAFKAWQARMREQVPPEDLIAAARHYAAKCEREGTEERFIKHPATFLGPSRPYEDYIGPPMPQQSLSVPKAWHTLRKYLGPEGELP